MSMLCIAAAGMIISVPLQAFTLMWTHSIEKIRWEEDYRVVDQRLQLVEARIRGSGAGMETPDGAVLRNGVWHYRPSITPLPQVQLARSSYVADYFLCWGSTCSPIGNFVGPVDHAPVLELHACASSQSR